MSDWERMEPLTNRDNQHEGPGVAYWTQWCKQFDDGTVGVVRRTFHPTATLGLACSTDYALYRSVAEPVRLVWGNYAGERSPAGVDENSVRRAAEDAEPPTDREWAEAETGAEWVGR